MLVSRILFLVSGVLALSAVGCTTVSTPLTGPTTVLPSPSSPGTGGGGTGSNPSPWIPTPPTPAPPAAGPLGKSEPPATYTTVVANLPGEDLAGPCTYDLYLPDNGATLRGIFVIFDRGDSLLLYADAEVRAQAQRLNLGLLLPHQCNAISTGDIQTNAFEGPGRALETALSQLAVVSSHPEVAHANLLFYGFSAAGVLSATTANYMPARVIGVIAFAAASPHQLLGSVKPSGQVLQIPFLLLSSDQDLSAGTLQDQIFFSRAWKAGAPWSWGVQHGVAHCCNLTTEPVILPWIAAVIGLRLNAANDLQPLAGDPAGHYTTFTCTDDGSTSSGNLPDCSFTAASILPAGGNRSAGQGWLPDDASAAAWLKWVGF